MKRCRYRTWMLATLLLMQIVLPLGLALALCGSVGVSAEPDAPRMRTYSQGPLTAKDFLATQPEEDVSLAGTLRALAYTATELHYSYRYRTKRRDRQWTATLTDFDAFGVILREESWNSRKSDRKLLDHEQGHFDLAEMWARRARAEIRAAMAQGQLKATGRTEQAAIDDLKATIETRFRRFLDVLRYADRSYDELTRYGTLDDKQAEQRKIQTDAIKSLKLPAPPSPGRN